MIVYSFIIPHKNIPDLLQRCLDSIPEREDVQVIVVDDNSDEDKVDFAHFPQWSGKYYEYYLTKEGKGAGYARNVGLDYAKGEWLVFMDADDFCDPSISAVLDEERSTQADIVFFRPAFVYSDDLRTASTRGGSIYNRYIDDYLRTGDEINLRTRWHSPWSKFIRKSLIVEKGIRFDEVMYSNDVMFSTLTGCEADTIVVRDKCYNVITERAGSLTAGFCQKAGELETRISVFFRSQQIVSNYGFPIDEGLAIIYLNRCLQNRSLFRIYFNKLLSLSGRSRIELINRLFETRKLAGRIKRKVYAFIITLF